MSELWFLLNAGLCGIRFPEDCNLYNMFIMIQGVPFCSIPDQDKCHGISWQMKAFCVIKLLCSTTWKKGRPVELICE